MQLNKYKFFPAIIWLATMTILFCLPGSVIPTSGFLEDIHFDKFVHFILFFVLVFLLQKPMLISAKLNHATILFLVFISAVCYGISIEFIQKYWIPNRSFDIGDIIADTIGSVVAYLFALYKRRSI